MNLANLDMNVIITGVLSSLVASCLFVLLLFRIRPNLKISGEIAKDTSVRPGETFFIIKVINRSLFYKIYDLKCSIKVYEKSPSHNAEDLTRSDLDVKFTSGDFWVLERFNIRHVSQWFNKSKKLKTRTDYAVQFGTKDDIERLINNKKIIRVEAFAKHPLSGFSKVVVEDYKHRSQIIEGSFCSGNCFTIK